MKGKRARGTLGVAGALAAVLLAVVFLAGPIARRVVERAAPKALGVPVTLEGAKISLLRGRILLTGLTVGNPGEFDTPHAFRMERMLVDVAPLTVFRRTCHVKRVLIESPEVTYEVGRRGSNLAVLSDRASGGGSGKEAGRGSEKREKPRDAWRRRERERTVVIDRLDIEGGRVRLSIAGLGGQALGVPLPGIHMRDVGRESGGATLGQAADQILAAVFEAAGLGAGAGGKAAKEGGEVGKALDAIGREAGSSSDGVVEQVRRLFE